MAANNPMIATAIISSISVNPRRLRIFPSVQNGPLLFKYTPPPGFFKGFVFKEILSLPGVRNNPA
jgi:hypothetical protein